MRCGSKFRLELELGREVTCGGRLTAWFEGLVITERVGLLTLLLDWELPRFCEIFWFEDPPRVWRIWGLAGVWGRGCGLLTRVLELRGEGALFWGSFRSTGSDLSWPSRLGRACRSSKVNVASRALSAASRVTIWRG